MPRNSKSIFILLSLIFQSYFAKADLIGGKLLTKNQFTEVISFDIQKSKELKSCTGTFISSNTILTASHCVTEVVDCKLYKVKPKNILISLNEKKPIKYDVKTTIINQEFIEPPSEQNKKCHRSLNSRYDIALIILKKNTSNKSLTVSTGFAKAEKDHKKIEYRTIGFGHSIISEIEDFTNKYFRNYIPEVNQVGKKQIGRVELIPNNPMMPHMSEMNEYSYDTKLKQTYNSNFAQIHPGDSGGPLINSKNEIVGINSTYFYHKIFATPDSDIVIGYRIQSVFTPLHREENIRILKSAELYGSSFKL